MGDPAYYTTYGAACYYAATLIVATSDEANICMVTYSCYSDTTYTTFTEEFKTFLKDCVTLYDSSEATAEEIFSAVEDKLIQFVDAGSAIVAVVGCVVLAAAFVLRRRGSNA